MRSYFKTPYVLLPILLGGCFLLYFISSAQYPWLKSFALDIASEITGIIIVVFSIDRVIAIEQENQRIKLETVAFLQLRRPLRRHFYLFFYMFKAAIAQKPDKDYKTITDLFDNTFFEELAFLDFSKPAPVFSTLQADWFNYVLRECSQFKDSLNRTMEKYCLFLQPEIIELMEEMINSPFLWIVFNAPVIRQFSSDKNISSSYSLLARPEIRDLLKEYIQLIIVLLEQYNQRVPAEKQINISDDLWGDGVLPKIGSGRINS